uniref:Uncharacterized protein n=1 Tax=Leptocylindrus danicus TaxID=163516 RepID=A0A7S2P6W4_9STRA
MFEDESLLEDTANKRLASILGYLDNLTIDSSKENIDVGSSKKCPPFANGKTGQESGARSPPTGERLASAIDVSQSRGDSFDSKSSRTWIWESLEKRGRHDLVHVEHDQVGSRTRKNAGNNIQVKISRMQQTLDELNEEEQNLQENIKVAKSENEAKVKQARGIWRDQIEKQDKRLDMSILRQKNFLAELKKDCRQAGEKKEKLGDEVERIYKARAEICKSENNKKVLALEDCRKGLMNMDTIRLKKLADSKMSEIRNGVAIAVEPEILNLIASNKSNLEQVQQKYVEDLSNLKAKIAKKHERELSSNADQIEKDLDSKCKGLTGQQQRLLTEMRLKCECDYKITRENHIRDMNEDRRQFNETRKSRISDNLTEIAEMQNCEMCHLNEKLSTHEKNMQSMKEDHENMILAEKSGRNGQDQGWKDDRLEILKQEAKENYERELGALKVTMKGEINMVKNKLQAEHTNVLANRETLKRDLDIIRYKNDNALRNARQEELEMKDKFHELLSKKKGLQKCVDQLVLKKHELQKNADMMKKQLRDEQIAITRIHQHADARLNKVEMDIRSVHEESEARVFALESKLKVLQNSKKNVPLKYAEDIQFAKNQFDKDMNLVRHQVNEALHLRDDETAKAERELERVTKQFKIKTDELDMIRRRSILN